MNTGGNSQDEAPKTESSFGSCACGVMPFPFLLLLAKLGSRIITLGTQKGSDQSLQVHEDCVDMIIVRVLL